MFYLHFITLFAEQIKQIASFPLVIILFMYNRYNVSNFNCNEKNNTNYKTTKSRVINNLSNLFLKQRIVLFKIILNV